MSDTRGENEPRKRKTMEKLYVGTKTRQENEKKQWGKDRRKKKIQIGTGKRKGMLQAKT